MKWVFAVIIGTIVFLVVMFLDTGQIPLIHPLDKWDALSVSSATILAVAWMVICLMNGQSHRARKVGWLPRCRRCGETVDNEEQPCPMCGGELPRSSPN